jgi:hypothetical protein
MGLTKLHNFCKDESNVPLQQRYHEVVVASIGNEVILNQPF